MSTNNNNFKQRQKLAGFESSYTGEKPTKKSRNVNPNAKQELSERFKSPDDFLASYLRKIYVERGIGWTQLHHYIGLHLRDVVARDPSRSAKDIGTARGNIVKELDRGTMTWKNFVSKIRLIRIREMEIQLTLTDDQGVKTVHTAKYHDNTIPVAMGPYDDEEANEDETDIDSDDLKEFDVQP